MGILDSLVAKLLPFTPKSVVRIVARRYIAGVTVNDAVKTVARLNSAGAVATVDLLGEFVKSRDVAARETEHVVHLIDEIARTGVKSGVSVKLTSFGLDIDPQFCRANLRQILQRGKDRKIFVRIDMENTPYTDETIAIAREMWGEFPGGVGIVLQAYLRRTLNDVAELAPTGISFRLCKGIYVEDESVAFKDRDEIRESYVACLNAMFDNGCFVGIATHDDALIDAARAIVAERNLGGDAYEFQMLLGVRESKRDELIREGHRMRIYVPFGEDWYGYSIRRLKENPAVAGHVLKAIFTGD
ncbi:MAG: proline dehydrogenase family protein [Ignavibacteriae bacterium]|nr:proline dehydrogenase family protein [Ignavibacteriota bacterium]MCB9216997.1 proline dehydrogenase family protein [Ignavibacteria bacterium]